MLLASSLLAQDERPPLTVDVAVGGGYGWGVGERQFRSSFVADALVAWRAHADAGAGAVIAGKVARQGPGMQLAICPRAQSGSQHSRARRCTEAEHSTFGQASARDELDVPLSIAEGGSSRVGGGLCAQRVRNKYASAHEDEVNPMPEDSGRRTSGSMRMTYSDCLSGE
ncbi:MAG TPA: hypothetical protein VGH98_13245 [Gemmatimonadaceae bacterium]